jgi:DeoR/GlpR family transcriptional regulator of sugar metabolism
MSGSEHAEPTESLEDAAERLAVNRRSAILELLGEHRSATVSALAHELGVSDTTIRRDLDRLQSSGAVHRTHGGAVIGAAEAVFRMPQVIPNLERKQRIGRLAATLVEDGDTIGLDAGTTTLEVARNLRERKAITLVTTDLHIAYELTEWPDVSINLTGGTLQGRFYSLTGPLALRTIREVHTRKVFIGASGLAPSPGATDPHLEAAQIKQAMIESSDQCIIVADSTKLGRTEFAFVTGLENISTLVTDSDANPELLARFREHGIKVLIA